MLQCTAQLSEDRARDATEADAMEDDVGAFMRSENGSAAAGAGGDGQDAPGLDFVLCSST